MLRIGIAGLGFGAAGHAPALRSLPNVEVVAIAGTDMARSRAVADKCGIAHACDSIEALLDLKLDVVTLALPPDQVADAVRAALAYGVDVLCEKPLGTNATTAAELAGLATGRITAMNFQFAELETFVRLKQITDAADLGRPLHAQVLWLMESYAHRHRSWSWKVDAQRGGGAISLFGSHIFFLAEWLFGPIANVWGKTATTSCDFSPGGAVAAEDLVHCRLEHANNVVCAATFGNASPGSTMHRWTVVYEHGTVILENKTSDYMSGFVLSVSGGSLSGTSISEPTTDGDGRLPPFRRLATRFLEGVRERRPVRPDFASGARVQLIDAKLRASAASGTAVEV